MKKGFLFLFFMVPDIFLKNGHRMIPKGGVCDGIKTVSNT